MRRLVSSLLLLFGLAACATNPIPEGYTGPRAVIADTAQSFSGSGADVFSLTKVNGHMIHDSVVGTRQANSGRGFALTPVAVKREVPATAGTFTIVGRRVYGAPILELMNKIYEISGDVEFAPEAEGTYIVKGELSETYSAVWLEDAKTGKLIGQKFEAKGSTALGILQK